MTQADPHIDFTLIRSFDAPRELVFETMSEPAHLQKWWGPAGCSIAVLDSRPGAGGLFHYCMRFGPGVEMYGRFDWRELTAPGRLVFVDGFSDPSGARIRHPMFPTWPLETEHTITLDDAGGATKLTLVSRPQTDNAIERQTFQAGHATLQQGFAGMYDVLARYLSTL